MRLMRPQVPNGGPAAFLMGCVLHVGGADPFAQGRGRAGGPFAGGGDAWRRVLCVGITHWGRNARMGRVLLRGRFSMGRVLLRAEAAHGGVSCIACGKSRVKCSTARDSTLLDRNSCFLNTGPVDFNSHLNRHEPLMWERAALSPVAIAHLICSYNERRCIY